MITVNGIRNAIWCAIAFGIGTSQVRDVLASQCLAMDPLKVRRIQLEGRLQRGVYAKDVILEIIRRQTCTMISHGHADPLPVV